MEKKGVQDIEALSCQVRNLCFLLPLFGSVCEEQNWKTSMACSEQQKTHQEMH